MVTFHGALYHVCIIFILLLLLFLTIISFVLTFLIDTYNLLLQILVKWYNSVHENIPVNNYLLDYINLVLVYI